MVELQEEMKESLYLWTFKKAHLRLPLASVDFENVEAVMEQTYQC